LPEGSELARGMVAVEFVLPAVKVAVPEATLTLDEFRTL
jgi:hypothetical protein